MIKHLRLIAVGALLAAPAARLGAQSFPTNDPVLQRIWTLGMDSSHTQQLAQVLFDSVGPRLTGSPGQRAGNDWLVKTYASWGIDAKNEQYGTWRGWRRGYTHIDLIQPRVRSLEGTMLAWSPGTRGKDVTAGLVIIPDVPDSAEFVKWLPAVKGKFVLVSPAMPTCRPSADWTEFATPDSKARIDTSRAQTTRDWAARLGRIGYSLALGTGKLGRRLEEAGALGVITSRPKDAWGTYEVFETYDEKAPAVAMSCEDYGLLYRLTEKNQSPVVRINTDAQLLGEQPVFNTIASIPGTEKPNEYVVLSAHFDSWDGSSGSTDNGTGTLTMMEAMRILKTAYPHPKRTILVGHWSSEEQGLNGSKAFTEDHPEVIKGLQALFNQDNGTGRIQNMSGSGIVSQGEHGAEWMSKLPFEFQSQIRFNGAGRPGVGGTDASSFACYGVPAFGLGALPWNYGNYTWHTNRDTYDKVVFDDLKGNATVTAMLAYLASEDPQFLPRERVDLVALAARMQQQFPTQAGRPARAPMTTWPECVKAPRSTSPRW
ncbi:MAG TPA: M20/M25/M40 family metallo-hydrolase [Gemmatimonadaceae bacterium]